MRECWLSSLIVKIQIEENRVFHEIVLCTKKKTICLASTVAGIVKVKKVCQLLKKLPPCYVCTHFPASILTLHIPVSLFLQKCIFAVPSCYEYQSYIFSPTCSLKITREGWILYIFLNYMYCIRWNSHCNSSCSQKWKVCKIHRIRTYFHIQIIIIWSLLFYAVYHR